MKTTQNYRLATLLAPGNLVTKEQIKELLGDVNINSIPVYIHELKKHYGADIESVREGRKVVGYVLKNKIDVPQYRCNNAQVAKKAKGTADGVSDGIADMVASDGTENQLDDKAMADIKQRLDIPNTGHQAD